MNNQTENNPALADTKMTLQLVQQFRNDGFVILRNFMTPAASQNILEICNHALEERMKPFELEAELGYPGAPDINDSEGGTTIRRLREVHRIDPQLLNWVVDLRLAELMRFYFDSEVALLVNHHNSLMTKQPLHGTATEWHQDYRYWNYQQDDLVTAWLALGDERKENGGMFVVPGSHKMSLSEGQFDSLQFFKDDLKSGSPVTSKEQLVELNQGDLLLFHCKTLHRAGINQSNKTKLSLVYSFKEVNNQAIANTRSAKAPESIQL